MRVNGALVLEPERKLPEERAGNAAQVHADVIGLKLFYKGRADVVALGSADWREAGNQAEPAGEIHFV